METKTEDTEILLWDGKRYDAEMIRSRFPNLSEYALSHDELTSDLSGVVRCHLAWSACLPLVLFIGTGFLYAKEPDADPLITLLAASTIGAGMFIASTLGSTKAVHAAAGTVVVTNGRVKVTRRTCGFMVSTKTARLNDISWFLGTTKDDAELRKVAMGCRTAIVIGIRDGDGDGPHYSICATDGKMFRVWNEFLDAANVAREK